MKHLKIISIITLSILFYNQSIINSLALNKRGSPLLTKINNLNQKFLNSNLITQKKSNSFLKSKPFDSDRSINYQPNQSSKIPKSSALTTTFCSNVRFHQEQASNFPVTLALARPILDQNGNVIAPVNSVVRAQVNISDEQIKIEPKAVVIGGRYINIDTSAVPVPALTDTRRTRTAFSRARFNNNQRGVPFRIADNLSNWLLSQQTTLDADTSDLLGFGLSVVTGLTRGINEPDIPDPEEQKVMKIRQGMKLIFPLKSSVKLPASVTNQNPYFRNQNSRTPCKQPSVTQNRNNFNNRNFDEDVD